MSKLIPNVTIGVDLGDRFSYLHVLDAAGECLEEGRIRTAHEGFRQRFENLARARVVIEAGPLTALTFALVIEDPGRFAKSRAVGAYLGLRPRRSDSGETEPQLRITKAGHPLLRRLLVQCAHYVMGPHGPDCDLRHFGERIAARGGKNARKRARVAVARKLAILLHQLWVSGETYEPLRQTHRNMGEAA